MADENLETTQMDDTARIIEAMGKLREGDFTDIDVQSFDNPELARAYNDMLKGVTDRNNQFLARVNDAMTRIGDSGNLKALLEQIESQRDSLKVLQATKSDLNFSMKQVEDSGYEMLALSRQIRNSYEPCSDDLTQGYEMVEGSIADIQKTVQSIKTRFDAMEGATPERVRAINSFVGTMQKFIDVVTEKKDIIKDTVDSMNAFKGRIEQVINDVLLLNTTVEKQNITSQSFLDSVDSIVNSYEALSLDAFETGRQLYRISRDVDNARNDIFRHNSRPTIHDMLRVYEVDHFVLSWRIYNHIMELETLKITQLNNPDRCKFGLWCAGVSEPYVRESDAFKHAFDAHEELHKHAVASFMAKEDYDMGLAKKEAKKTLEAFEKFQMAFEELHTLYFRHGIADETPLWKFK